MAYDILVNKEIIDVENMEIPFLNGADVVNADVINQDAAGTGNDNAVNGDQINNAVDNDVVSDPNVTYSGGNGGGASGLGSGGSGGDFIEQATAQAAAASSTGNQAYVGDDGTVSNAGNASSIAAATAGGFSQRIETDANTQVNAVRLDISGDDSTATGGGDNTPASYHDAIAVNNEILDAYRLQVDHLEGLQLVNADIVNQNVSGPGNDTAINLDQINNLVSNDLVDQADVTFNGANGGAGSLSEGSDHTVTASATAGNATSTGNFARIIGGDGSISSAGNAESSATADGHAFTQTVGTGGNVQSNSVTAMIDGGTSGGQEGPAGFGRDHLALNGDAQLSDSLVSATFLHVDALDGAQVLNADVVNQNATGSGNDNAVNLDQMNNMVDRDAVMDPNVSYVGGNGAAGALLTGPGSSGGDFTLTVTATAAVALATSNTATVADDGTISGAGTAKSAASATAEAFTQSIDTGGNTQANQVRMTVEGGTVVPAGDDVDAGGGGGGGGDGGGDHNLMPVGSDDGVGGCQEGCGNPGGDPGGNPGGHAGGDDPSCYPDVCADDQIGQFHDPAIALDTAVIDASSLSVDCLDGLQFLNADVVNQDVSGSGNDNAFHIDQINNLVDNDYVSCPDVSFSGGLGGSGGLLSAGADGALFQLTATATSAAATSSGNYASVGDDGSVTGAGDATSSASATADAFSQTIVMGANVQFNSMDLNLHGGTDSL